MSCEFLNGNNPQGIVCNTPRALKDVKNSSEEARIFTITELKEDICLNPDSRARELCRPYKNLRFRGKNSRYRKKN